MKTYNKFVDYYDEIIRWSGYDIDAEVDFLDQLILNYSPLLTREGQGVGNILKSDGQIKGKILEFACGTGTIARELVSKWYSVEWIDLSEEMIERAKTLSTLKGHLGPLGGKSPQGDRGLSFHVWNMTSIDLNKQFDIVLCNYNSVCHLQSWEDWLQFFENAYKHLRTWWVLIFDILTIFEFENIVRDFRGFFNIKNDSVCLEMFSQSQKLPSKEKLTVYTWLIKMFVHKGDNNYTLVEEEISEISFPIQKITQALESIWFNIEHIEDFHTGEITPKSERVYFVAKK